MSKKIAFGAEIVYLLRHKGSESACWFAAKNKRKELSSMYAVKVLHGYISTEGQRTRDKRTARVFQDPHQAERFAKKIGGRVKELVIDSENEQAQEAV